MEYIELITLARAAHIELFKQWFLSAKHTKLEEDTWDEKKCEHICLFSFNENIFVEWCAFGDWESQEFIHITIMFVSNDYLKQAIQIENKIRKTFPIIELQYE